MSAISQLTGSLGFISDVTFSPDNRLLASVGTDGVLRLWNTQSDAQLAAIETGIPTPRMVRFSPDGTLIAVTGDDDTVRLYAVPTA
jgi:WD40 repeat protein